MPLLQLLRNPGLRKRHWVRMTRETGVDLHRLRYINGIELRQYGAKAADEETSTVDYKDMTKEQIDELNAQPVNFTFYQAVHEYKLDEQAERIRQISEAASKEFAIEQVLVKLEDTWRGVVFTMG